MGGRGITGVCSIRGGLGQGETTSLCQKYVLLPQPGTNADLRPIVSSPLYFITSLTALFESIAMIVDQHQPVVEKYYGTGKMASVLERLLQESDRVTKGLIDNWIEERSMKRKVCFHCAACNRYVSQRYSSLALRHCQLHLPNTPNILFSSNSKSNINYEHS